MLKFKKTKIGITGQKYTITPKIQNMEIGMMQTV